MPHIKPLNEAFKIETYALQRCVKFSVEGVPAEKLGAASDVDVPVAIVYRLHHLGRAFDGQAAKHLVQSGLFRIGFMDVQRLIGEMELVSKAVVDPVTQHYLAKLLPLLRATSASPASSVKVAAS